MTTNYSVFATALSTIPAMTAAEKLELLATLRITYAAALEAAFDGLLPGALLVEFGAEMTAIWAALEYTPKAALGGWAA
jgi:hypothetical protein